MSAAADIPHDNITGTLERVCFPNSNCNISLDHLRDGEIQTYSHGVSIADAEKTHHTQDVSLWDEATWKIKYK